MSTVPDFSCTFTLENRFNVPLTLVAGSPQVGASNRWATDADPPQMIAAGQKSRTMRIVATGSTATNPIATSGAVSYTGRVNARIVTCHINVECPIEELNTALLSIVPPDAGHPQINDFNQNVKPLTGRYCLRMACSSLTLANSELRRLHLSADERTPSRHSVPL
ncbi:hypothetical protein NM688_g1115 [Phlebia brevispora]|uniref:Uncharacterized protein n=1 Tax=Phlebia brevispora TaxID=194682 RepID=A0ACC1TCK8_9APHY|nr:hypothetical protein NM688_g1115 [Phlebia brevispora]